MIKIAVVEDDREQAARERLIRVYVGAKKERLYLSVTNTAFGTPQRKEGRFLSQKGETHGFGLLRVDRIVARASGYLAARRRRARSRRKFSYRG